MNIHQLFHLRVADKSSNQESAVRGKQFRKRYIPPSLGIADFFQRLKERQVRYVVLRWFDELPRVEPGRDIDILIADEDIARIEDLFTSRATGQPVDLYSVSGLPGSDYAPWFMKPREPYAMSLFPPALAERILDGAVMMNDLVQVPNQADHFFSLAYHAAYLKGARSGLLSSSHPGQEPAPSSHDYAAVLAELAENLGFDLPHPLTYEVLDDFLADHGWRPPRDALERISLWSPWLRERLIPEGSPAPDGLAVFFIRQRAVADGFRGAILQAIRVRGFEILLVKDLDEKESRLLGQRTRGGNWGPGPFAKAGGPPACVVVALDVLPVAPSAAMQQQHPLLDNSRIPKTKFVVRNWINSRLAPPERYNQLHSTDNKWQAWDIVNSVVPEEAADILERARTSIRLFNAGDAGTKELTRLGNRARVELIEVDGRPAIRKTFKPHCGEFFGREVEALSALADSGRVPRLLATGENYLVTEYFEDGWKGSVPFLLPLRLVRQLAEIIRYAVEVGYDPIDFMPRNNLILTPSGDLKAIDFEFCIKRHEQLRPELSYCLSGVPLDFKGSIPFGVNYVFNPYVSEWYPYTGLSLHSFLYHPEWRQRLERGFRSVAVKLRFVVLPRAHELGRRTHLWRGAASLRRRLAAHLGPLRKRLADAGGRRSSFSAAQALDRPEDRASSRISSSAVRSTGT